MAAWTRSKPETGGIDVNCAAMFRRKRHSGPDLKRITPRVGKKRGFWARVKRRLLQIILVLLLLPWLLIGSMRWIDPFFSSFMLITNFERAVHETSRRNIRYQWVDYEDISRPMRLAVIAAEDQKFPRHSGFDWKSIWKALVQNVRSGRTRGGSTISQQVAKNLFLWREQSFLRKGIEAYLTMIIELLWPKQRILEVYLNIAQFSPRHFGVFHAARHFFHTTPGRLNNEQAAMLAAVLPAPTQYDAGRPTRYVLSRQYWILKQMQQLGPDYLDPIEVPSETRFP